MKKALLLSAVLLFAVSGFGDIIVNNFTGYNDQWAPFGNPDTATYGELFTPPPNNLNLASFSFYTGTPFEGHTGNIIMGAYIATWTGQHAGELLFSSPEITYDNMGDEQITVNTGGLILNKRQQYVMFLSVSQYYGQSDGQTSFSSGSASSYLNGFVDKNNEGDFDSLFSDEWNSRGQQPDLAVNLEFNSVPEPGSLMLMGTGILGAIGVLRRKLL